MKVLTIEAAFELPEDFTGGVPEALEAMAMYLRSKRPPTIEHEGVGFNSIIWAKFWQRPVGYKLQISSGISKYEMIDGVWTEEEIK